MVLFLLGPVILAMPPFAGLIVFVAAVFAVASLSAFAFERPIERWLRLVLFGRFSAGPPRKAV
jgi:peptidoglycan/LPS O-acetylase OafA/YrhL